MTQNRFNKVNYGSTKHPETSVSEAVVIYGNCKCGLSKSGWGEVEESFNVRVNKMQKAVVGQVGLD